MISMVGYQAAAAGALGAGCGYVYGSLAHADKKVATLAFAVFFAVNSLIKVLALPIKNPSQAPGYEVFGQQKKEKLNRDYLQRVNIVIQGTRALNLSITTLAFRHFELIGKRGTIAMSLACLCQVLDLFPAVQALKQKAALILGSLRDGSTAPTGN